MTPMHVPPPEHTSARSVLEAVAQRSAIGRRTLLAIVGPPGVGKTYAVERARQALDEVGVRAATISMDGYHLSNAQLESCGLADRKGSPDTFDTAGLTSTLARVRDAGPEPVFVPDYDRRLHEPIAARGRVDPECSAVLVEGNYLLLDQPAWRRVRGCFDITWYLDAPDAVRRDRLMARQLARGRGPEEAARWIDAVDVPNAQLISTTRPTADYVTSSMSLDAELAEFGDPRSTPELLDRDR